MEHVPGADPALTVALALAAGLVAQAVGHHLRIPGIVMLLGAGFLLGPDLVGMVRPDTLGGALPALVGFAVAVILFEGGLNLDVRRLRRESHTIQRLITVGALVTALGAMVAARRIMGWDWRPSILFGTLVIVTGPTVIGPIVRRIRLKKSLATVLEGEGVLIDPIGAILSVVALDVALQPSMPSLAMGVLGLAASLGFGTFAGLLGGFALVWLLNRERLVPEGLENVFVLAMVLALFHLCNVVQMESGIAAVTVAGVVVGNRSTRLGRELREFKEQLTVMFIGMLFVILAADVRFADLEALGRPGLWTVAALLFLVRPLNVLACTVRSDLGWRERAFLSWMAPRGIVAAAVASYFALEMDRAGVEGGPALRALVFLVILVSVTAQGLTGGPLARALGVSRGPNRGWAILGANGVGLAVGGALRDAEEDVVFLDSNGDATRAAEDAGFRVVFGNALEESTLLRAGIDGRAGTLAVTPNEEVNLLFATRTREELKVPTAFVSLHRDEGHVTPGMVRDAGVSVLFGSPLDYRRWESCAQRGVGRRETWIRASDTDVASDEEPWIPEPMSDVLLPLTVGRGGRTVPVSDGTSFRSGDRVSFLVFVPRAEEAATWLAAQGWEPAPPPPGEADGKDDAAEPGAAAPVAPAESPS